LGFLLFAAPGFCHNATERRLSFSTDSVQSKSPKNGNGSAVPDPRVCVAVVEAEAKNVTEPLFWRAKFEGHPVTSPASNSLQWKESFTLPHSKVWGRSLPVSVC
jgi:hypothetical protein